MVYAKHELTLLFLKNNKAQLHYQETQWRGHGGITSRLRPSANPKKKYGYGVFPVPDNFNIITLGVGDAGVTSCGDEGKMTLNIFRNLAKEGTAGLFNLDEAEGRVIKPGIFKAAEYVHGEKGEPRLCPNWDLSTDSTEDFFQGYTRTKAAGTGDKSLELTYSADIVLFDDRVTFAPAGDLRQHKLFTGNVVSSVVAAAVAQGDSLSRVGEVEKAAVETAQANELEFSLKTYVNSLNIVIPLSAGNPKTDASYPWTYSKLEKYDIEDLKTLLKNTLKLHFSGWGNSVETYINNQTKTELIKKISLYGKRLIILFNCSWIEKAGREQNLPRGKAGNAVRGQAVRTITELATMMDDARELYTGPNDRIGSGYAYIIENKKRKDILPSYEGQGLFTPLNILTYSLCHQTLAEFKEVDNRGKSKHVAAGFAIGAEDLTNRAIAGTLASSKKGKQGTQLAAAYLEPIRDSSSDSSSGISSGLTDAQKQEAREKSFNFKFSPMSDEGTDEEQMLERPNKRAKHTYREIKNYVKNSSTGTKKFKSKNKKICKKTKKICKKTKKICKKTKNKKNKKKCMSSRKKCKILKKKCKK